MHIGTDEIMRVRKGGTIASLVALLGLIGWQAALGQDSGTVTVDVEQCFELESAAARRECFGAQVDAVLEERGQEGSGPPTSNVENARVDQAPKGRDDGLTRRQPGSERSSERRLLDEPRETVADDADDAEDAEDAEDADDYEYAGTIVALRERLPNAYIITLDNGQVWQQIEPKRYLLRTGLEVRVRSTNWGKSYRLTTVGSGTHIQVRRVQ